MDTRRLEIWEDIYAQGEQLNKAPFDEVVSFVFRYKPDLKNHEIKIMEVGCGVGNNLKFFSQHGFACYGIDGSAEAIRQANSGMSLRPDYEVRQGDFRSLAYDGRHFDLVIDRASLWYVDRLDCQKSIAEIRRVLKPGGKFLFTPCQRNSDDRTGEIRFDTLQQALSFLPRHLWTVLACDRADVWDMKSGCKIRSSHFRIVAEKRA